MATVPPAIQTSASSVRMRASAALVASGTLPGFTSRIWARPTVARLPVDNASGQGALDGSGCAPGVLMARST